MSKPTRRELMSVPTPMAFAYLRFSPDGATLAINQRDNTLSILRAPPLQDLRWAEVTE